LSFDFLDFAAVAEEPLLLTTGTLIVPFPSIVTASSVLTFTLTAFAPF